MRKLNQHGVAHWILPVLVIAVISAIGVRLLTGSFADTQSCGTVTHGKITFNVCAHVSKSNISTKVTAVSHFFGLVPKPTFTSIQQCDSKGNSCKNISTQSGSFKDNGHANYSFESGVKPMAKGHLYRACAFVADSSGWAGGTCSPAAGPEKATPPPPAKTLAGNCRITNLPNSVASYQTKIAPKVIITNTGNTAFKLNMDMMQGFSLAGGGANGGGSGGPYIFNNVPAHGSITVNVFPSVTGQAAANVNQINSTITMMNEPTASSPSFTCSASYTIGKQITSATCTINNVPATVKYGQSITPTFTIKNTGTTDFTPSIHEDQGIGDASGHGQ
jgi:hypothetical protein